MPAALTAPLLPAQRPPRDPSVDPDTPNATPNPEDIRLPNGKKQLDEILKADYEKNLSDARELTGLARSFEEDLEKNEAFVLSLSSLKKLDDVEKLTKRIRARLKRA
jgi:hypothetical protein